MNSFNLDILHQVLMKNNYNFTGKGKPIMVLPTDKKGGGNKTNVLQATKVNTIPTNVANDAKIDENKKYGELKKTVQGLQKEVNVIKLEVNELKNKIKSNTNTVQYAKVDLNREDQAIKKDLGLLQKDVGANRKEIKGLTGTFLYKNNMLYVEQNYKM